MTKKQLPIIILFSALTVSGCSDKEGPVVEKFTITENRLEMLVGETAVIETETVPPGAEGTVFVEWTSSDESVAIVDGVGNVTAVGGGDAVITALCDDIAAICDIHVYGDPEVGDFYYSDGTYSKDLRAEKTVIGVVFWTGSPSRHDAVLRVQQPQCRRGLVVSLTDIRDVAWQSGAEECGRSVSEWLDSPDYVSIATGFEGNDPLNLMLGYNNTKVLEAFNAAPENAEWPVEVAGNVVEYRAEVPCPERSSGWYLPSPKEMSLMCSGEIDRNLGTQYDHLTEVRDLINPRIEEAGGKAISEDYFFWTSSESAESPSMAIMFSSYGSVGSDYKTASAHAVRCILAF